MNSLLDRIIRWFRLHRVYSAIPPNSVICDIGCGHNPYFLKSLPSLRYGYGFDAAVAGEKTEKYWIREHRLEDSIPLDSESVDVVTCLAVVEHLSKPEEIIRECARILKPGGCFIVTTPTPAAKPVLEFLAFRLGLIDADEIRDHKAYYTREQLLGFCKDAGLVAEHAYFEFGFNHFVSATKSPK